MAGYSFSVRSYAWRPKPPRRRPRPAPSPATRDDIEAHLECLADGHVHWKGRRPEGRVARVVFETLREAIPADHDLLRTCGDRECVAPAHHRLRYRKPRGPWPRAMEPNEAMAAAFARNLREDPSGCLLFAGYIDGNGFGRATDPFTGRISTAHRVAWQVAHGPLPKQVPVFHTCGKSRACCRVEHLHL
jgi:hypothetical protein